MFSHKLESRFWIIQKCCVLHGSEVVGGNMKPKQSNLGVGGKQLNKSIILLSEEVNIRL